MLASAIAMAEPTPDAVSPASLAISTTSGPDTTVLGCSGELDIASAPALTRALDEPEVSGAARLVIDLTQVTFMDSTGLRALLLARQQADASGQALVLRPGPNQVQRVFELSGTLERFTFENPGDAA